MQGDTQQLESEKIKFKSIEFFRLHTHTGQNGGRNEGELFTHFCVTKNGKSFANLEQNLVKNSLENIHDFRKSKLFCFRFLLFGIWFVYKAEVVFVR